MCLMPDLGEALVGRQLLLLGAFSKIITPRFDQIASSQSWLGPKVIGETGKLHEILQYLQVVWPETGPEKPKRSYLKLGDMEEHKSFILAKRGAGMKHEEIVDALKAERGLTLPIHKLKRLLDMWGACGKSLTKSRMLFIKNGIKERQQRGKQNHKVILSRPGRGDSREGRKITQEVIDEIMGRSPGFFKGVKLNPKETVAVFSTPTPRCGSAVISMTLPDITEEDMPDDVPSESCFPLEGEPGEMDMDDDRAPGGNDNGGLDDSDENVGSIADDHPASNSRPVRYILVPWAEEWGLVEAEENTEDPDRLVETLINMGREATDTITATKEDSRLEPSPKLENDNEEVRKIVVEGLGQICSTEEATSSWDSCASDPEDSEGEDQGQCECGVGAEHETALDRYACLNRYYLWAEVDGWKAEAREFLGDVERMSAKRGVSLRTAADAVSREWEDYKDSEPLPYHIYKQILAEDEESVSGCHNPVEGVNGALLCGILQDNFATLVDAVRGLVPGDPTKGSFDEYVVHLPFVMAKFGPNHLLTALCLTATGDVLEDLVTAAVVADTKHFHYVYGAAFCVFNSIGMATCLLSLDCFLDSLDQEHLGPELALAFQKARSNTRKMIVQTYGRSHPKTLLIHARLVKDMFGSPTLRQRGEFVLFGILQTFKTQYQVYSNLMKSYALRCFGVIGEALLYLGRSDLIADSFMEPSHWEQNATIHPAVNCKHLIGVAYAELGKHKESLQALFSCLNGYRDRYDINHPYSQLQIAEIIKVMNQRGPVLYNCLDSIFEKLLRSLKMGGKTESRAYQTLYEARRRGGIDAERYADILALTSNRPRTPDMGLLMYTQGLECWLAHKEVPFRTNLGGWVEEDCLM
ncbi:hypothetical protein Dda_6076 [Drechslerella dactyloides]|uniref:Uncharacterized protein n=1 Tax=Drechslerella dactyloides TaxID=74499 RepID=A0AAD6NJL5_DREDA|nr:hypothetical protein Dda_6076 [Drechslerella dactyloides]